MHDKKDEGEGLEKCWLTQLLSAGETLAMCILNRVCIGVLVLKCMTEIAVAAV